MFHVKHLGPVAAENLTRPRTAGFSQFRLGPVDIHLKAIAALVR
jgi:hypothetical protein